MAVITRSDPSQPPDARVSVRCAKLLHGLSTPRRKELRVEASLRSESEDIRRRRGCRGILELYRQPYIKGFTTNPTLMRKAGITDYRAFASEILARITDRPISFEVLADDAVHDGSAGARNRQLGRERLRENSGDKYNARADVRLDPIA